MIASDRRDALLDILRAGGTGWTSARDLALHVYGFADASELHAVYVVISRARQAGVPIETGPQTAVGVPRGYRLVGEGE